MIKIITSHYPTDFRQKPAITKEKPIIVVAGSFAIATVLLCHKKGKGLTDTVAVGRRSDERRQAPHTRRLSGLGCTLIKSCASAHGPARVAASATYVRISLLKKVGRDGSKRQRVAPQGGGAGWGGTSSESEAERRRLSACRLITGSRSSQSRVCPLQHWSRPSC